LTEITSFKGAYSFLSNFYSVEIEYDGIVYPSVEHAYQAAKTDDLEYRSMIAEASTPAKAKKLGSIVPLRHHWDLVKITVMKKLLQQKFSDPVLFDKLRATAPAKLVEGNWWGDKFWGVHIDGQGYNWLGILLMEIRDKVNA
jgi:ribA/ribD-fused uncharacterized protein